MKGDDQKDAVRCGYDALPVRYDEGFVPEGDSGHALFWARRPQGR